MKCCNRKDKGQTMICKELHIYIYITKYRAARPHYKPAIFTTRPNLHERNHVNKLWLWDEPDVRKISMSMDRVGNCVFHHLFISDWFVAQSECIYNCIIVWTVHTYLLFTTKWAQCELYHRVNKYNNDVYCVLEKDTLSQIA
jgi:hypothetical protein